MRIAITGASGFIGKSLVRALAEQNHELILLGRNAERLQTMFPDHKCYEYTQLATALSGVQTVLHLAAELPRQDVSLEQFIESNVGLTDAISRAAREANVSLFVNYASLGWNNTPYSKSKKQAEELLSKLALPKVVTLRLPAVYSDEFRGRLAVLNKLPAILRPVAFQFLASLRPTVHIDRVVEATLSVLEPTQVTERIVSDQQRGNFIYAAFKKLLDYGFAFTVIVLFFWLMAILYIAIRLDSRGPGIFAQTRIGLGAEHFTCYKFRTMKVGTKSLGTHEVGVSAVTRIGGFLRKTKLDELPQVFNILRGEVGLVGPRPCLPVQEELIEARNALGVNATLPGITGHAQINGVDMSDPQKLAKTDAEYLALRSVPMDIKIIAATFLGRGSGDRVAK